MTDHHHKFQLQQLQLIICGKSVGKLQLLPTATVAAVDRQAVPLVLMPDAAASLAQSECAINLNLENCEDREKRMMNVPLPSLFDHFDVSLVL
jgi:hypothetical protein